MEQTVETLEIELNRVKAELASSQNHACYMDVQNETLRSELNTEQRIKRHHNNAAAHWKGVAFSLIAVLVVLLLTMLFMFSGALLVDILFKGISVALILACSAFIIGAIYGFTRDSYH